MLYHLLRSFAIFLFKIIFRIEVKGKRYIPKKGGFILASNHASFLDPIVLGVGCPRRLDFMARHDLFYNPLFSWLISRLGAFPIKRDLVGPSALKEAMRRLKNGRVLVLFPEGGRRIDRGTFQPHQGIGFLAAKLSIPVIPAFIKGTDAALPPNAKFIRCKKISLYFGKQISIKNKISYYDIALSVMENIKQLSREMRTFSTSDSEKHNAYSRETQNSTS